MTTDERWAWIDGFCGFYQISDRGRVRSVPRTIIRSNGRRHTVEGRILRPYPHSGGLRVTLAGQGPNRYYYVHKLVQAAFGDQGVNAE